MAELGSVNPPLMPQDALAILHEVAQMMLDEEKGDE